MPSLFSRRLPTTMRNANTGPASHGVQLSRETWAKDPPVGGLKVLEVLFLAVVST